MFPRKNHSNLRVNWVRIGSENCTGRARSTLDETSEILNRIFDVHGHLKFQKAMDFFFARHLVYYLSADLHFPCATFGTEKQPPEISPSFLRNVS